MILITRLDDRKEKKKKNRLRSTYLAIKKSIRAIVVRARRAVTFSHVNAVIVDGGENGMTFRAADNGLCQHNDGRYCGEELHVFNGGYFLTVSLYNEFRGEEGAAFIYTLHNLVKS